MIAPVDQDNEGPRSSKKYLENIQAYHRKFSQWHYRSDRIDQIYSSLDSLAGGGLGTNGNLIDDEEFNLFWASIEVIKPSIYSRPPVPIVTPRFHDRSPVKRVAADLLERSAISGFELTDIDQVMLGVRDDLVINGRGVLWVSYEDDGDEKVCVEDLDRDDFAHEPTRKWREVSWVARCAWMTREEVRERFPNIDADNLDYTTHKDKQPHVKDAVEKAAIWEVWDKTEKKVVWVTEGMDTTLDEDKPHLKLKGFFPCPRPAYGTLQRRSLVPTPDFIYIESQLATINDLTIRIHDLCNKLVVRGVIRAGSSIGDAVEKLLRDDDASSMLIPVEGGEFANGSSLIEWLPIDQVAQTILAAVQARQEIIGNVQELLGIADIMRGDSDARETYGAQQLKAQYGSVRIRDRVNELVRLARDAVCLMAEIMAEEFDIDTLLQMAQMELPTDAEIKSSIKLLEKSAKDELKALSEKAEEAMLQAQQSMPPEEFEEAKGQAAQEFQQAQQQIIAKYSPQVEKLSNSVTIEMVKDLLDDSRTDPFIFDIETDSTILPDEQAAKQSNIELATALGNTLPLLSSMIQMGGADAAGELIKDILSPFRPGRGFLSALDEMLENVKNNPPQGQGADEAAKTLAASQMALAEAEAEKARAQMAKVQADSQLKQAELQGKMQQMQVDMQERAAKLQLENGKLQLQATKQEQEFTAKMADMDARQNLMQAQTAKILAEIGFDARKQDLEEYRATTETQLRANDQAMSEQRQAEDSVYRAEGENRANRQQEFTERQAQEAANEAPPPKR